MDSLHKAGLNGVRKFLEVLEREKLRPLPSQGQARVPGKSFHLCKNRRSFSIRLKEKIRKLLSREKGAVYKDPGGKVRVCLVYPNTYSVGMSSLGFQTLYSLFNGERYCVCERAFLPDKEDVRELREKNLKLFSLESETPLLEFDIVAFSVSFEEDYMNIPAILEMSGIPAFSSLRRARNHPLVMAGGCAVSLNPEPVADFMDLFFIGEAEGRIAEILEYFSSVAGNKEKEEILEGLSRLAGIYVPSFYEFGYDGLRVASIRPISGAAFPVKRARADAGGFPLPRSAVITPDTEFSGTSLIEIERGCPRGCRFCAAGFMYLPPRWGKKEDVKKGVESGLALSARVGLVGAAVSEYPDLKEILRPFSSKGEITLSSLRVDNIDYEMLSLLKEGGLRTVTVAPEAGSERLRRVINKDFSDEEILDSARCMARCGFKRVKLYFMVGLPAEKDDDCVKIAELSLKIKAILKGARLILSVNPFVPKPFTPFQWHAFLDIKTVEKRCGIIREMLKKEGGIEIKTMPLTNAIIQAYLSRADRRAGNLILEASRKGWRGVLKKEISNISECVYRERGENEIFPWDTVDTGLKKTYLWKEYRRGLEGKTTPPCDVGRCFRCGVC